MIDISVTNLVKEFEVGSKILDGLTFQVDSGERVGLLGPNGCGKTTLLRILTGVMDYDEGEVVIAPGKRVGLISNSRLSRGLYRGGRAGRRLCRSPRHGAGDDPAGRDHGPGGGPGRHGPV